MSQLAAYNMTAFRKAAGLTQEELGERLGGWSAASVSAAERSWGSRRVKKFDADELTQIANALGVPLIALFLPPEDHGTAVRYTIRFPGPRIRDLDYLLNIVLPMHERDSPAMEAYRKRLMTTGLGVELTDLAESMAQQRARQIVEELRAEDRRRYQENSAPREAARIISDAAARAEAFERDVQEKHRQAVSALNQQRVELERRIDELRAFEREYRTRLQALLEGQLKDLWEGVAGLHVTEVIDELRKGASRNPGQRVSGVLLREDGTYDVVQFGPAVQEGNSPREERQAPEADGTR